MEKFQVVCVGAAVQDVFLCGKIFTPKSEDGEQVEEFSLGSKNDVDKVVFSTGGGATNAAVTFARQGLKAAYLGKVGKDVAGQSVRHELEQEDVDVTLMGYADEGTGFSALLLAPTGERTILTYRGASIHYEITREQLSGLETDWLYISSLEGNTEVVETLMLWANEHDVKVAWNPGKKELEDKEHCLSLLNNVHLLSLNLEEMQQLFVGETKEALAQAATAMVTVAVVTDGPQGLAACDGRKLYTGGMYEDVPVIDRTGAGDAFCSGFTSALIAGQSIEEAITLGSANSTSVVGQIGAKAGILHANQKIHAMSISVTDVAKS